MASKKTIFVKEGPDKKGRIFIIEGTHKPGGVFSITRFICEVQDQGNESETQAVVDLLLEKLNI